jgi:hypothetical protein
MPLDRAQHIISELVESIKLLNEKEHYYPAIMLNYTLIDVCGWIKFGTTSPTNKSFKDWVKQYILLDILDFPFNETDLWAHRCGLLHMHSSESRDFMQGHARSIAYSFKSKGYDNLVELLKEKDPEGRAVAMDVEEFNTALFEGAMLFLDELSSSHINDEAITTRLGKLEQFKLTKAKKSNKCAMGPPEASPLSAPDS